MKFNFPPSLKQRFVAGLALTLLLGHGVGAQPGDPKDWMGPQMKPPTIDPPKVLQEQRQPLPSGDILLIRAEKIRRVGRVTFAEGNVSTEVGGIRIDCQSLEFDPDTHIAKARKECIFFWGESYAAADEIDLDTVTRRANLRKVSGRGNDLATSTKFVEQPLYFWADELIYTPEKIDMTKATLTTCDEVPGDWHYRMEADRVEIYPRDHLDATGSSITFGDTRLLKLPTVTLSLDGQRSLLQDFVPTLGYSSLFGAYLRSRIPFVFDKNNFGRIHIDYYTKSGLAGGIEHQFTFFDKGAGNIFYYRQAGVSDAAGRLDFRTNLGYQIDRYTSVGFSYGQNRYDLPGFTSPLNVGTSIALSRNAPGSTFQIQSNFSRSGDNTNTGYRVYYEKDLSERTSAFVSADYSLASTLFARTQRTRYLASVQHRGDWFDADLSYENNAGQNTYFLNRQPEFRFRTHPFYIGSVPFIATAAYGEIIESPSNIHTTRGDLRLFIPDQTVDWGSGRLQAGAGFRELFYGTHDSERVVTARTSVMQNLSEHALARLDFNLQLPSGTTPFQSDFIYSYETVTGGLEFYDTGKFRVAGYGGYDLLRHQPHDVIGRVDCNLGPGWSVSTGANFDPNQGRFRSVDTQFSLQLSDNVFLSQWNIYDFTTNQFSYRDVMLRVSEHDWDASVAYRGIQNEVFFQFSLKAFPSPGVKIGPNTSAPILPQNLPNAFVR